MDKLVEFHDELEDLKADHEAQGEDLDKLYAWADRTEKRIDSMAEDIETLTQALSDMNETIKNLTLVCNNLVAIIKR